MDKARVIEVIRQESVLIDRAGIVSLYEAAPRRAGLGLDGMIHQAGVRGARLLQERLGLNGEALLEAAFNASGWGRAPWARREEGFEVKIEGSIPAEVLRPQKKPVCHPLAGHIAGFLEVALGRRVRVREGACAAVEGTACRLLAEAHGRHRRAPPRPASEIPRGGVRCGCTCARRPGPTARPSSG